MFTTRGILSSHKATTHNEWLAPATCARHVPVATVGYLPSQHIRHPMPVRKKKGQSVDALQRTLSLFPGKPTPLKLNDLPAPALRAQLQLAHTRELTGASKRGFKSAWVDICGTVIKIGISQGDKKASLHQMTFGCKVPPPPATANEMVSALAETFHNRCTLAVYCRTAVIWIECVDQKQLAEWEKVRATLPSAAHAPART